MTDYKRRLIIEFVFIFILLTVFGISFYLVVTRINKISTAIRKIRDEELAARLELVEFTNLKGNKDEALAALTILRRALPERDDLFSFRGDIEQMARNRNLRSGFSFGAEVRGEDGQPGHVNFSLSVEGSLSSLMTFLRDVENLSYLLEVGQVSITGEGAIVSGKLDGKIFFTE